MESRDHLFFNCPFSSYLWEPCKLKLGMSAAIQNTLPEEAALLESTFKGKTKQVALTRIVFKAAIWHIWRERNSRIFQHQKSTRYQCLGGSTMIRKHCSNSVIGLPNSKKTSCVIGANTLTTFVIFVLEILSHLWTDISCNWDWVCRLWVNRRSIINVL